MSVVPVRDSDYINTSLISESSPGCSEDTIPIIESSDFSAKDSNQRRQSEERDKILQASILTIDRLTRENEQLRDAITENKVLILDQNEEIAELESDKIVLERQVTQYRQAGVQPVPIPLSRSREEVSSWERFSEGVTHGASSVGRFCRRNRRLFEAGMGVAGGVLAIYFAAYAIPIVLVAGAGVALFDWVTSWFD